MMAACTSRAIATRHLRPLAASTSLRRDHRLAAPALRRWTRADPARQPSPSPGRRLIASAAADGGPGAPGGNGDEGKRPTLLVLGGNGFVGRQVVRLAAGAGFDVLSISRRGAPDREGDAEPWEARVTWLKGDVVKDPEVIGRVLAEELGPYRALSGVSRPHATPLIPPESRSVPPTLGVYGGHVSPLFLSGPSSVSYGSTSGPCLLFTAS